MREETLTLKNAISTLKTFSCYIKICCWHREFVKIGISVSGKMISLLESDFSSPKPIIAFPFMMDLSLIWREMH
jgi:hypothetical protein